MARPQRIEFPGAFYHVTSRGNKRDDIFFQRHDYQRFLDTLGETCERYGLLVHCYCLMTNHYHLLVETPEPNLSTGIGYLNGVYTQRINRKYNRCGHLFQGRFTSIVVDTHMYYKTLLRYVLQNPVRAHMVNHPAQHYWSSYNATVGKYPAPEWLVVNDVLAHYGESLEVAVANFSRHVSELETADIWSSLTNRVFLGDDEFAKAQLNKRTVTSRRRSEAATLVSTET